MAGFTLQIAVAAYLLYMYLSGTPKIPIPPEVESDQPKARSDEPVGKVGDLGVGTVEIARFVNFNEDKTVSREFGFETLLHKTGDQWEIAGPFMNIYQPDFDCRITAQKGMVVTEGSDTNPTVKDITLRDNVHVRILPRGNNNIGPISLYLDDIVFFRDRSLFLTAGPVKMISGKYRLLGRGLELIYNYELSRLELLRIIDLESLHLYQTPAESARATDQPAENETLATDASATKRDKAAGREKYQAVLSKNVTIKTAKQLAFAGENLTITNVLRPKRPLRKTDSKQVKVTPQASTNTPAPAPEADLTDAVVTCDGGLVIHPVDNPHIHTAYLTRRSTDALADRGKADAFGEKSRLDRFIATQITYDASKEQITSAGPCKLVVYDSQPTKPHLKTKPVTITCDDSAKFLPASKAAVFDGNCVCGLVRSNSNNAHRYTLSAPQLALQLSGPTDANADLSAQGLEHIKAQGGATITVTEMASEKPVAKFTAPTVEYSSNSQRVIARCPSTLKLYTRRAAQQQDQTQPDLVTISAQKRTQFLLDKNKVIFEGGCRCEFIQSRTGGSADYILLAETITADLSSSDEPTSGIATDLAISKLTARGDAAVEVIAKKERIKLAEFTAGQLNYVASQQSLIAPGPSRLRIFTTDLATPAQATEAPVTIAAEDKTVFSLVSNQAVFHGNCVCTMLRTDAGLVRKYRLAAPELTIKISQTESPAVSSMTVEHLTASNGATVTVMPIDSIAELARFTAPTIRYDRASQSIVAEGPTDFSFYANDFVQDEPLGAAVPVRINAQTQTTFMPKTNLVVFQDNCICTAERANSKGQDKYTLSAPRLTIYLSEDTQDRTAPSALRIERVVADGGLVQLSSFKTSSDKLLSLNKLKCTRFDYSARSQTLSAQGPGVISVDNSRIEASQANRRQPRLQKRCYAFLRDFDMLEYYLKSNHLTARADSAKMLLDYFPIIGGARDDQIKASAARIEIDLHETSQGQSEIAALRAGGGITYEDQSNEFVASELFYDAKTSSIQAVGNDIQTCMLNGVLVDKVLYDLRTGTVSSAELPAAGPLAIGR